MKLFTKEINNKLFKQFPLGNDLEKQVVVAKIFNPYGRGKWYLINSDPSDPDYIWAIVDNYEVEIGSVSRRDLENLRITAFGWPLERDIYFSPMNAAEVFRGLRSGKRYATGGNVSMDESVQMVSSQAKEAKHHANELSQAIKGQTHIEPWVVAKMERATTDLSDVTHYLDGKTEYAKGGEVKERVYIEYLNKKKNYQRDIKHFDSYEDAKQWAVKNFDKFNPDMIKYEYAKGGGVGNIMEGKVTWVDNGRYGETYLKLDNGNETLFLRRGLRQVWYGDIIRYKVIGSDYNKSTSEIDVSFNFQGKVIELISINRNGKDIPLKYAKGGGVGKSSDKYTVYLYYGRGQEPSIHKNVSLRTAEMLVMTAEHAEIVDSKGNVVDLSQYAEGGMATFDDKVKAISERLEGTKVKGKYRKEYGATYDKKESKQAATKIAGKMRARERAKEILNKRKKK